MANVYDFLPLNWAGVASSVETSWLTDVVSTNTRLAESRRSLVSSPRREITVRWTGMDQEQSTRLLFLLMRAGNQRLYIPLYPDVSYTTALATGTSVPCDTTERRLYVGKRIALENSSQIEHAVIASMTDTEITLTAALSSSFPRDSRIYPVLEVEITDQGSAQVITDHHLDVTVGFSELRPPLPAALDYSGLAGEGFQQIESKAYLLDLGPDWKDAVALKMSRSASVVNTGRDFGVQTYGPRATLALSANFNSLARVDFMRLLKFFDAHRGRAIPFWVACPLSLWEVSAITNFTVDVSPYGDIDDYNSFVTSILGGSPYLLLELEDGTSELRQVTGATAVSGAYRLDVALTLAGVSPSDVARASLAFYVRFDKDTLSEEWITNTVASVALTMVEVMRWESVADQAYDDQAAALPMDGYFGGGSLCGA